MASPKKGQRERQQRALQRLQERISDNKYLYERLDLKLMVAEGPLRRRILLEMKALDNELHQLEAQEVGLLKNIRLRLTKHISAS